MNTTWYKRPITWVNGFALVPAAMGFFGGTVPSWVPAISATVLALVNLGMIIVLETDLIIKHDT